MGKKFTLEIKLGNDAMQDESDLVDVVSDVALALSMGRSSGSAYDINGHKVGGWEIR